MIYKEKIIHHWDELLLPYQLFLYLEFNIISHMAMYSSKFYTTFWLLLNLFTNDFIIFADLKWKRPKLSIMLIFQLFTICWLSRCYKTQGELQDKITIKNDVICIELSRNLYHFIVCFDANKSMFWVKLQRIMPEVVSQRKGNGDIEVIKRLYTCAEKRLLFLVGISLKC